MPNRDNMLLVVGGCGSAIIYIKTHFMKETQVLSCFLAKFAKAPLLIILFYFIIKESTSVEQEAAGAESED